MLTKTNNKKIILGIETSCDETSAAVIEKTDDRVNLLSNIVASSAEIQAKYGGIIPEQAAREQLKSIFPVIQEALNESGVAANEIDAIAVTQGPGLIGSLLVGVETAKTLSLIWNKPLIPVNHLMGHFYANWINLEKQSQPSFPCLGLLVSGGHSDLILLTDHGKYQYLGGTRDDAAGEAFDKTARLLGLPYPGGPQISKIAENGDPKSYKLPKPMAGSKDLDFSFSGLKTAVLYLVQKLTDNGKQKLSQIELGNLAASLEETIVESLVKKTVLAAQTYDIEQIIVAGGVAANKRLRVRLEEAIAQKTSRGKLFIPPPNLCTDNAAYIATAAAFNYQPTDSLVLQANPNLSLSKK